MFETTCLISAWNKTRVLYKFQPQPRRRVQVFLPPGVIAPLMGARQLLVGLLVPYRRHGALTPIALPNLFNGQSAFPKRWYQQFSKNIHLIDDWAAAQLCVLDWIEPSTGRQERLLLHWKGRVYSAQTYSLLSICFKWLVIWFQMDSDGFAADDLPKRFPCLASTMAGWFHLVSLRCLISFPEMLMRIVALTKTGKEAQWSVGHALTSSETIT